MLRNEIMPKRKLYKAEIHFLSEDWLAVHKNKIEKKTDETDQEYELRKIKQKEAIDKKISKVNSKWSQQNGIDWGHLISSMQPS